ncbi:hypothetical protein P7C73_g2516, partial [Tremellales sp. Uapishka_1]
MSDPLVSATTRSGSTPTTPSSAVDPLTRASLERSSEDVGRETIVEPLSAIDETNIHSHSQRGDTAALAYLLKENPDLDLSAKDSQEVTPLHWAAINAHMGTCRWLLDNGAEVDAVGGELRATPLQWAARNGHLYVVHLLLARGADPNLFDSQGFNTLHLITHSSAVMPLLYMLHQPVAIDEKDTDGHTALMWAAYQGDAISVDLLIRHGASVVTRDNAGLTPLHWAVVKGNKACIKHLVLAGADLEAREEQGKSPRDMAEELKGLVPYTKGLEEAGYSADGRMEVGRFSELNTRLLLAHKPFADRVTASPYFAGIITASLFWVAYSWATRIASGTPGHALENLGFVICILSCSFSLYRAITVDPGFVPKPANDQEIKEALEELVDAGRLNGANLCIMCMRDSTNIQESAPPYVPVVSPGLTLCDISTSFCQASSFDSFLLAVALWSTLQLTWTIILLISQLWQVSRQMTTFEVSNLGRYGYMGGRGGQSLREQSGAVKQPSSIGAGIGPSGAEEEAIGPGGRVFPASAGHVHGANCKHGHGGHDHSHGFFGGLKRFCGAAGRACSGPMMQILGLDRFTKGKAVEGLKRAGRDQNPFDMGLVKNCTDFWMDNDVDYTQLYEIPPEGWKSYRRRLATAGHTTLSKKGGYEPISREEV